MSDIIIIGAPRSGTNMLRDILTSFSGIGTWPCDEINYIWRHGNARYPSDEIPPERASPPISKYIRNHFENLRQKQNLDIVVEKTCANCLRLPFVDRILPEAKYVYIYRDGIDASASAMLCWEARLNIPYLLTKSRYVPKLDLPYYALRYFWAQSYRFFSKEKRLAFWGPSLNNMKKILRKYSIHEICALQWQCCVELSETGFSNMPEEKRISIRYEDFVQSPKMELTRIMDFIGREVAEKEIENAVAGVSKKSIGKGRKKLGNEMVHHLELLVGSTLKRYDYL